VTRPHHPLRGQEFEILRSGKKFVEILRSEGTSMRMPRSWTDVDGNDPCEVLDGDAIFTTQSLKDLKGLLEALSGQLGRKKKVPSKNHKGKAH
jgi:hypothetical protein